MRPGGIDTHRFVYHCLQIRQLHHRCRVDLLVPLESRADLVLEASHRLGVFAQIIGCCCEETYNRLSSAKSGKDVNTMGRDLGVLTYTKVDACAVSSSLDIAPSSTSLTKAVNMSFRFDVEAKHLCT